MFYDYDEGNDGYGVVYVIAIILLRMENWEHWK